MPCWDPSRTVASSGSSGFTRCAAPCSRRRSATRSPSSAGGNGWDSESGRRGRSSRSWTRYEMTTLLNDAPQFLRAVTAFAILEEAELEALAAELQPERYSIGQTICRAGEPGDSLYLVYAGRARVISGADGGEMTVGTLSRGDHF